MKKLFFTLLAATACVCSASAAINYVVVTEADGAVTNLALDQTPEVKVVGSELQLYADGTLQATVSASQEVKVTFSETLGLETLAELAEPTLYWDRSTFRAYSLEANSPVAIYNVQGMLLWQGRADAQGAIEVSLEAYSGILIINTSSKTIKISK